MIYQKDFFCPSSDERVSYTTAWLLDTFDFLTRVDTNRLAIAETDMELYVTTSSGYAVTHVVSAGTTTSLSSSHVSYGTLYVYNLMFTDYCVLGWVKGAGAPSYLFLTLENGSRAVGIASGFAGWILDGKAVSTGGSNTMGIGPDDSVYLYPALLKQNSTGRLYEYQPAGNIWSISNVWNGISGVIYTDAGGKLYMYCSNTGMIFGG